jgi:hypothetical protein
MVIDWSRWFLAWVICSLAIRNLWPINRSPNCTSSPAALVISGHNGGLRPRPAELSATDQELHPGDRVEGWGNFGKPTGEFGRVEQANQDDVIINWDDDGRMGRHQPWLKKLDPQSRCTNPMSV